MLSSVINTSSLSLFMGVLWALSLHSLRGYVSLIVSFTALMIMLLGAREHKLLWGAVGIGLLSSAWVCTLSWTAGVTASLVGFGALSLLLSLITLLKLTIIGFTSREPTGLSWVVLPLSLAGLDRLCTETLLMGYPLLSEAFLLEGTSLSMIGKYGFYTASTWLYYLTFSPFLYALERFTAYGEFMEIKELILSRTTGKLREVLDAMIRGERLRRAGLLWLLRGVTVILIGLILLPSPRLRVLEDEVRLGRHPIVSSGASFTSERELRVFLSSRAVKGGILVLPEMSLISEVSELPPMSRSLSLDLSSEGLAVVGGVVRGPHGAMTGALIYELSDEPQLIAFQVKRRLVPFGEYMPRPFRGLTEALNLTDKVGSYQRGEDTVKLYLKLDGRNEIATEIAEVLICSESFFPELVSDDVSLIIMISNRMWYGRSSIEALHEKSYLLLATWKEVKLVAVVREDRFSASLRLIIPELEGLEERGQEDQAGYP